MWKYRFYFMVIIGFMLECFYIFGAKSNFNLILWGIGILISAISTLLQIVIAPNFNKKSIS